MGGDFEPMMTNEDEVVRAPLGPHGVMMMVPFARNRTTKDAPKDFGRYSYGNVEGQVASSFELDHVPHPFFDFPLKVMYVAFVDLAAHTVRRVLVEGMILLSRTYIEDIMFS